MDEEHSQLNLLATVSHDSVSNRTLIDQLIAETRLYSSSEALKDLFEFTASLRDVAPFNAMLLHIQKPGISYVANARDWLGRFGCRPKPHARPLVVLRNFGPVDFVYDILDVEGGTIPDSAWSFPTRGAVPVGWIDEAAQMLLRESITLELVDEGDRSAGRVWAEAAPTDKSKVRQFHVVVNANHDSSTQFVTLVHELGHVFLGHCAVDEKRKVRQRNIEPEALREVEAESVAWIVAKRSGVHPRSDSYLEQYQGSFEALDLHAVLKAAGRVEKLLRLPLP